MSPHPSDRTACTVAGFEVDRWLLWRQPTSAWAWQLTPLPDGRTRPVTRIHVRDDWRHPAGAALALVLCEVGDWPMMRRTLLGIRDRAEAGSA